MAETRRLQIHLPLDQLSAFFLLFQQGVWLRAQTGCSVMSLLTNQFGIEDNYIIDRITTLFLDGKPVDDAETSYVKDGSTVALSSAMPGLVGATLRRGGHLAAMRGTITCQSQQEQECGTGRIRVKLFNMVMRELGAILLAHGICLSSDELEAFLSERSESFWQSLDDATLNGRKVDSFSLKKQSGLVEAEGEVLLVVEFNP